MYWSSFEPNSGTRAPDVQYKQRFRKWKRLVVPNLAQELPAVSKTETTPCFEPNSGTRSFFKNWKLKQTVVSNLSQVQAAFSKTEITTGVLSNLTRQCNSSRFKNWNNYCSSFESNQAIAAVSKTEITTVVVLNLSQALLAVSKTETTSR